MLLTIKGIPGKPYALLIHPELADLRFFDPLLDQLDGRYRVVLPTLDGHHQDSPDFSDPLDQAVKIDQLLAAEGIRDLELVLGCGVGATIALRLLSLHGPHFARRIVLDSAHLSEWQLPERHMARRLAKISRLSATSPARLEKMLPDLPRQTRQVIANVARDASAATVRSLAHACFGECLPGMSAQQQSRVTFAWGRLDGAGSAHRRVARAYPYANIEVRGLYPSLAHLCRDPEGFARCYLLPGCEQYRAQLDAAAKGCVEASECHGCAGCPSYS